MVTVRLCWVEGFDDLKVLEGEIDASAASQNELVMDAGASPGPAGVYRRFPDDAAAVFDPQDPRPVFLLDTHQVNTVTWMKPLQHIRHEATLAQEVWKTVADLVEAKIGQEAGLFSASSTVTSTEKVRGSLHVVGRCVVIRPMPASGQNPN